MHTEILMITFMADDHDVDINDGPDDADGRDPDENSDVQVNRKMEEDPNGSHDFLTLVGLVSYYGDEDD